MTNNEIANKLVEYCRKGQYKECYEELYSPACVSIESPGSQWPDANGMAEMATKGQKWNETVEAVHSSEISEPLVAGDWFSISMKSDITYKGAPRTNFDEIALYKIENGKIVSEQFFYNS